MSLGARRIPDPLLECFLVGSLDEEARAEVETALAESKADRARFEELRAASEAFLVQHLPGPQSKPEDAANRGEILEALFRHQGFESIVLSPPATEVMRTVQATALLEKWFAPVERVRNGLPYVLLEHLTRLVGNNGHVPSTWERTIIGKSLKVTFVQLPEQTGRKLWALMLQEVAQGMPSTWRELLSARETEVVERLLRGWDNMLIAEDLGCKEGTVKKHLQRIFDKLGMANRAELIALAVNSHQPESVQARKNRPV